MKGKLLKEEELSLDAAASNSSETHANNFVADELWEAQKASDNTAAGRNLE
jgi:hypothetical protein